MIAAVLRELIAAGVSGDALVAAIERIEAAQNPPTSADNPVTEKRRAYDRERQRAKRASTRLPPTSVDIRPQSATALILPSLTSLEDKKEKKERARKFPCPPDFQPSEKHFAAAAKLGVPPSFVHDKAEDMRLWAQSSGALKVNWDMTLHVFIRRDA